ncbi:MAG: hypothetical protein ACRDO4_00515 [Nocardioides sp.]
MFVRRTAVLAVAAAVLLAGCQDEPEPRFEPTPTESPSESDPSEEPEAQTAEEFIRAWVALDAAMQQTGESSAYLGASANCTPCTDFAMRVEKVYAAGGEIRTDGWRVVSIQELQPGRTFRMVAVSSPQVVIAEAGAQEQRYEGGRGTYDIALRRVGDSWKVIDWNEVAT